MKNKTTVWILTIGFVILLGGATLLYNNLSTGVDNQLLVQQESAPQQVQVQEQAENDSNVGVGTDVQESDEAVVQTEEQKNDEQKTDKETDVSETAQASEDTQELQQAPDFEVFDLDGNAVKLSDFQGKPVIVNFWASWCGPCKSEMPDFEEMYQQYDEEIHFVMVNMTDGSRETVEVASEFISEQGYTFPVYYDTEYSAAITYWVTSIPATYFIDAQGNSVAYARSAIDAETLQMGIDMIYNK